MTIATVLGSLNLLAIVALAAWLRHTLERNRRTEAQHRLDVIARLGGVTVAVEKQTETFHADGTALLREVRAAAAPASPVPPPPASGTRAAEPEQDVQERPTVEMDVHGRDSAEELTGVLNPDGKPWAPTTRLALVMLRERMAVKGGAK